jgi:hypothetical protein
VVYRGDVDRVEICHCELTADPEHAFPLSKLRRARIAGEDTYITGRDDTLAKATGAGSA